MNKEQLLQELSAKVSSGEISRDEVTSRLPAQADLPSTAATSHFSVNRILYILGAIIVIAGIIIFVSQVWEDMESFGRIAVTLGMGLLITGLGSILHKKKPGDYIGPIFHFMGGVLIPGGVAVTLTELYPDYATLWPATIAFGAVFVFYFILDYIHKHPVLTFFAIANGTAFIYLFATAAMDSQFYLHGDFYAYLTMVIGISYILLARAFREGWNKELVSVLNFFGTGGFLGAAFSQVFDSRPWEMFYFIIVIGGIFLSIKMKSRSMLLLSTLFLIIHLIYITSRYFTDSLGWPISLIILGFIIIGIGYFSISLNKKYLA